MIKAGDICTITDVSGGAKDIVKESLGLKVRVTLMPKLRLEQAEAMCWVMILEGPWQGMEAPCLVSRLT